MTIPSAKQMLSYKESNARINIWEGAVRSGKTYASLWRFIKELTYGPTGEYAIVCRTYDTFKRNVLEQLMRMIGSDVRHYSGKREMHLWGKKVHIIGADDERAEAKIRGATFAGAYVDEATIIPETVFKMLISRCSMGGAKIFATTNPDSPYHWLKVDFLSGNNPDVASWQFRLDDNPQLSKEDKAYLPRQYKGLWYQRFIEGKWVQAEGAVYDFFDPAIHTIPYPASRPEQYIVGIDYGTANPCVFVLLGINYSKLPNIWVEEEYYFDSKAAQRQKTDYEYAEDLKRFIENKPITAIYMDPSAVSFRVELQKQGFQNIYEAENEVVTGINYVANLVGGETMKICRNCKHLIQEFQSYVWDAKSQKKGIDKPLKQDDHALDALRYAIFTHKFGKDGTRLSPRDLDRIQSEAMEGGPRLPRFFSDPIEGPYTF